MVIGVMHFFFSETKSIRSAVYPSKLHGKRDEKK